MIVVPAVVLGSIVAVAIVEAVAFSLLKDARPTTHRTQPE